MAVRAEYTLLAGAAVTAAVVVDVVVLRTRLLRSAAFWVSMAVVWAFQVLVDGWLTKASDPIVLYDDERTVGIRLFFHSPVEDFAFGFALVLATLSVWTALGRRDAGAVGRHRAT